MAKEFSILLVDDSPSDHLLADEAIKLGKLDIELLHAESGRACLELLRESDILPDLILLDLRMPEMDGFQVLMEMSNDPKLVRIPVLVLSSSGSPEDVRLAYDLGCKSYIVKPVDFNQFITVLSTLSQYWMQTVLLPHRA